VPQLIPRLRSSGRPVRIPSTLSLCVSGCVYLQIPCRRVEIGDRGVRDRGPLVRFDLPEPKPCSGTAAVFFMT
jgi:hypothetical protein